MKPPLKARWYPEVLRSPLISDSVRVLLIALHDDMNADGFVSVPRKQLAVRLGKTPRRVAERFEQAVAAGFLDRVRAGRPTVTAEYRAMLPNVGTGRVRPSSSKPLDRLTKPKLGADDRTMSGGDGADVRMVRIAAPIEGRTTAPSAHAQHGADDRPANHTATAVEAPKQHPGSTSELLSEEMEVDATPDELAAMHADVMAFAEKSGDPAPRLVRLRVVA